MVIAYIMVGIITIYSSIGPAYSKGVTYQYCYQPCLQPKAIRGFEQIQKILHTPRRTIHHLHSETKLQSNQQARKTKISGYPCSLLQAFTSFSGLPCINREFGTSPFEVSRKPPSLLLSTIPSSSNIRR